MTTCEHTLATSSNVPVYLKLPAATMIWGGTFVAGRFLADSLTPLLAASLRFLLWPGSETNSLLKPSSGFSMTGMRPLK